MNSKVRLLSVLLLLVPLALSGCSSAQKAATDMVSGSLLSMLGGDSELSTLASLVSAAGIGDLLGGDNPLTLLAPTNDAFSALGDDVLQNLTKPENQDQLTDVLKNHVIPGKHSLSDLASNGGTTMLGNALDIAGTGDAMTIGGAGVVAGDMEGSNGFVQKIDKVLLP
jgi:uncharacterized surface protein with fasciclin (FAS1) repeats